MPKTAPKKAVTKKVTKVTKSKVAPVKVSKKTVAAAKANPILPLAAIIASVVFLGPLLAVLTGYVITFFLAPAVVAFFVAFTYKNYTGVDLTEEMRRQTTTIASVLGVILVVLWTMMVPTPTVNQIPQDTYTMYQIIFRSLWVIVGVLVTVYLPLGVTVPKSAK